MPSILKCSGLTNLFKDFKFIIGRNPPERLGITNRPLIKPTEDATTGLIAPLSSKIFTSPSQISN